MEKQNCESKSDISDFQLPTETHITIWSDIGVSDFEIGKALERTSQEKCGL